MAVRYNSRPIGALVTSDMSLLGTDESINDFSVF